MRIDASRPFLYQRAFRSVPHPQEWANPLVYPRNL